MPESRLEDQHCSARPEHRHIEATPPPCAVEQTNRNDHHAIERSHNGAHEDTVPAIRRRQTFAAASSIAALINTTPPGLADLPRQTLAEVAGAAATFERRCPFSCSPGLQTSRADAPPTQSTGRRPNRISTPHPPRFSPFMHCSKKVCPCFGRDWS